jgi:hypothetical protein
VPSEVLIEPRASKRGTEGGGVVLDSYSMNRHARWSKRMDTCCAKARDFLDEEPRQSHASSQEQGPEGQRGRVDG